MKLAPNRKWWLLSQKLLTTFHTNSDSHPQYEILEPLLSRIIKLLLTLQTKERLEVSTFINTNLGISETTFILIQFGIKLGEERRLMGTSCQWENIDQGLSWGLFFAMIFCYYEHRVMKKNL